MKSPTIPFNEAGRLASLHDLEILDTPVEERFDRLTRLACRVFDVPMALVSLVDARRQWFKSRQGVDATETPRAVSFCGHAILNDEVFVVPDASQDNRFHDNPLVTGDPFVRFYAGCPLRAPDGNRVGVLCLIDTKPREFSADDAESLRDLASLAEQELAALAMATTDELTGLSNRRGFEVLAHTALEQCRRADRPASLLFFDLDKFKRINDTFGHAAGDRALIDFGQLLLEVFRGSDVIGRISGDEFAVLTTGTSREEVQAALDRFDMRLGELNTMDGREYQIAYSVGAECFIRDAHRSIAELMNAADQSMYRQKRAAICR